MKRPYRRQPRRPLFSLLLGPMLAAVLGVGCASAETVTVTPGDDLAEAARRHPAGTTFVLEPGTYRRQSIKPRDRQQFIGKGGAILNGALLLDEWQREGALWVHEELPDAYSPHGQCEEGRPLCTAREDLFLDGRRLQRAASRDRIESGFWFYESNRVYLSDDPTGRMVEYSSGDWAFHGAAEGVVLRNLIVEKYATRAQQGAIQGDQGADWQLLDMTVRNNHGTGLRIGKGMIVRGGRYNDNGQLGIGGIGDGATIENVEVARNNYAGYSVGWEAGGIKLVISSDLAVRNSCIHDNNGIGIWTDGWVIRIAIEGNRIYDNQGMGIVHEISYDATIRDNIVARNARNGYKVWRWGSNILVQNSQRTEIAGNTVEVGSGFGHGINLLYANRKHDRSRYDHGPLITVQNHVHDNTIIHLGAHGHNGSVADYDHATLRDGGNVFERNTYIVPDADFPYWEFNFEPKGYMKWPEVKRVAEHGSRFVVEQRAPMSLACAG